MGVMGHDGDRPDRTRRRLSAAEIETLRATLSSRYRAPLMAFFNRRTGNFEEAEDLAHEVLLRVLQRPDLSTLDQPDGFIFATARNILKDRSREAEVRARYQDDLHLVEEHGEGLSPERVIQGRQELQRAMAALGQLTEKTRDMFILKRLEGMKYGEIAQLYGVSVSAVEKHIIKAIAHIADTTDPE